VTPPPAGASHPGRPGTQPARAVDYSDEAGRRRCGPIHPPAVGVSGSDAGGGVQLKRASASAGCLILEYGPLIFVLTWRRSRKVARAGPGGEGTVEAAERPLTQCPRLPKARPVTLAGGRRAAPLPVSYMREGGLRVATDGPASSPGGPRRSNSCPAPALPATTSDNPGGQGTAAVSHHRGLSGLVARTTRADTRIGLFAAKDRTIPLAPRKGAGSSFLPAPSRQRRPSAERWTGPQRAVNGYTVNGPCRNFANPLIWLQVGRRPAQQKPPQGPPTTSVGLWVGEGTRTPDSQNHNLVLYPTELHPPLLDGLS
jgi:hypothetical protein